MFTEFKICPQLCEYLKWISTPNIALETANFIQPHAHRCFKRYAAMIHLDNRCHHPIA